MKLIFCPECQDIIKLTHRIIGRKCICGKSWGYYEKDGHHATIGGEAVVVGIDNRYFGLAVFNQREHEISCFDAWIFPKKHPRVKQEGGS